MCSGVWGWGWEGAVACFADGAPCFDSDVISRGFTGEVRGAGVFAGVWAGGFFVSETGFTGLGNAGAITGVEADAPSLGSTFS